MGEGGGRHINKQTNYTKTRRKTKTSTLIMTILMIVNNLPANSYSKSLCKATQVN